MPGRDRRRRIWREGAVALDHVLRDGIAAVVHDVGVLRRLVQVTPTVVTFAITPDPDPSVTAQF
jgi:hypothetical protein